MIKKHIGILLVTSITLCVGCHVPQERQTIGTVLGGAGGAVIGTQFNHGSAIVIGAAAGAIIGALITDDIGSRMDETDKIKAHDAFQEVANKDIGETIYWENSLTGHSGSMRPIREGYSKDKFCREFETKVHMNNETRKSYGTVCRDKSGTWLAV